MGELRGIWTAPAGGAPMEPREEVVAHAGSGLEGDRYAEGTGYWPPERTEPVTLVVEEDLRRVEEVLRVPLEAGLLRRNLLVSGVAASELIGASFRIGDVRLRGVRPCDPCRYLEKIAGVPGLKAALRGRGGVRATVEAGGVLTLGAALDLLQD